MEDTNSVLLNSTLARCLEEISWRKNSGVDAHYNDHMSYLSDTLNSSLSAAKAGFFFRDTQEKIIEYHTDFKSNRLAFNLNLTRIALVL